MARGLASYQNRFLARSRLPQNRRTRVHQANPINRRTTDGSDTLASEPFPAGTDWNGSDVRLRRRLRPRLREFDDSSDGRRDTVVVHLSPGRTIASGMLLNEPTKDEGWLSNE